MTKITIKSKNIAYSVLFIDELQDLYKYVHASPTFCIYDSFFEFDDLPFPAIRLCSSEELKTLDTVKSVLVFLSEHSATKKSHILAIGGGIIQDISTMAASLYMRGVRWTYVPTTLLGMVDSCVGGKSSINIGSIKNLAGNFHPPHSILICPEFVNTLSTRDVMGGLLEAVKICYAHSDEYFYESRSLVLQYLNTACPRSLAALIVLSLSAKKSFIEIDEFDTGTRRTLNFGHTFGHALESASAYALPHGVAVGIGMLIAFEITSPTEFADPIGLIYLILSKAYDSKVSFKLEFSHFLDAFKADKKHTEDFYFFVLPHSKTKSPGISGNQLFMATLETSTNIETSLIGPIQRSLAKLSKNTNLTISF